MKMKKILLAATAASFCSMAFASSINTRIDDINEKLDDLEETQSEIAAHDGDDNIKWGINFRTAYDNINYNMADGSSRGNNALATMRLQLKGVYKFNESTKAKFKLGMNKAFGADFNGRGSFVPDWVGSEILTNNELRLKEASWVYKNTTYFENLPFSISIGRRPATDGSISQYRDANDDIGSPISHVINAEFDGFSNNWYLGKLTGVEGMFFKLCGGVGSTNAMPKFKTSTPYAKDDNVIDNIPMIGFVFKPYDDGHYVTKINYFKAYDMIGVDPSSSFGSPQFVNVGDAEAIAASAEIHGFGDDGFISSLSLFLSVAASKSYPKDGGSMYGSTESETGYSIWFGGNAPVGENGLIGIEYNHGSKYWKAFTFAEDTMSGSKIATRGDAYEAFFNYEIAESLSAQIRYTYMKNEYTGSQGFFGDGTGVPFKISDLKAAAAAGDAQAIAMLPNIIEDSQDFKFSVSYRF